MQNSEFRIREHRLRAGLTLKNLADASGISVGLLSQVERGRADPSLATLRKIASVLSLPIFDLFANAAPDTPLHVQRAQEQLHVTLPNHSVDYARVSAGFGDLEVLRGILEPFGESSPDLHAHNAEECVVVVVGRLTLETNVGDVELNAGDSCHFRAEIPHRYVNSGDSNVTFYVCVTPPSI